MQISPKVVRILGLSARVILLAILALSLGGCKPAPKPTATAEQGGSSLAAATSLAKQAVKTPEGKKPAKTRPAAVTPTLPAPTAAPTELLSAATATTAPTTVFTPQAGPTRTQAVQAQAPTATQRTASRTQAPTATTAANTPQPTNTQPATTATTAAASPTATSPANSNSIMVTGRVLRDGDPAAGIVIQLETSQILTATTNISGTYTFNAASLNGDYSVTFSQEANPALYSDNQVASWAWLDSYAPSGITRIEAPDMDISLLLNGQKFEQQSPTANATVSASSISRENPLRFEWSTYPQPLGYWVDLGKENELTPVWQSYFTNSPSFNFTGLLSSGASISPGNYWWNIGMQKQVEAFTFTVYGHPWPLVITP